MPKAPCSHCALTAPDGQRACTSESCPWTGCSGCRQKGLCPHRQDIPGSLGFGKHKMLSLRLPQLLQPLIWTSNLPQRFHFSSPSGCLRSKETQKAQLGYPKIFKEVGKFVSSFSISLLITWGRTTQHLWKQGYMAFSRQCWEDPMVQLTSSIAVCFAVVKQ